MRRLVWLPAAVLMSFSGLLCAASSSVSQPTFWRYTHPQAKALFGIDWRGVVNSPMGAQIATELRKASQGHPIGAQGLEFLAGLERILISTTSARRGGAGQNPPAVVALSGNFDLAKIRQMLPAKTMRRSNYRSVELLNSTNSRDRMCMALVSRQIVLLGDRPSVQAAIDHHATADPAVLDDPLFQRAAQLASHYEIWFLGEISPGELAGPNVPQAALFQDIESMEGGVSLRDGLGLQLNLNARSEESARALGTGIQAMTQLMMMGKADQPELRRIAEQLRVGLVGSQVQVALQVSQEDLNRGISQARAGMLSQVPGGDAVGHGTAPSARPAAVTAVGENPSRPMEIRIYNMDGGTRVVPYSKR